MPPRYLNLTLSWSWPPTIGAVGVVSNRGAPYTVQMSNNNSLSNTWPWPCLGLDRPQSGRSELSAIGALLIPLQCLTVITSQIHDHDLVLVLTAHNRGGRSCQQPGRSLYRLKCLTVIHYNTWPWPCLGLDRPQSGRSELSATGALLIPFKCLTVITSQYMNMTLSWSWPPTIGAVGVVSNRGAPYTVFKCL